MKQDRIHNLAFWFIIILISLLRLWVQTHLNYVVVYASLDDTVSMMQTASLLKGDYLGPYGMMTLAKGYTYTFFLYGCSLLHLPYSWGLSLVIMTSHFVILQAYRHLTQRKLLQIIFYTVISFVPIGHNFINMFYFYRNALIPYIVLFVIGSMILIYEQDQLIKTILYSLLGGISLCAFIYCREDYLWLMIFVIIIYLVKLIRDIRRHHITHTLLSLLIVIGIIQGTTLAITMANKTHYGISLTNDRVKGPFATMMTLIYSVEDTHKDDTVWITYSMLDQCIRASEHLKSIETCIDHAYTNYAHVYFPDSGQIEGDFMQWVMRNALLEAGYYQNNAAETQAFIEAVNSELKTAYDNGTLTHDHLYHISSQLRGLSFKDINFTPQIISYAWHSHFYPQCHDTFPQTPIAAGDYVSQCESITYLALSKDKMISTSKTFANRLSCTISLVYKCLSPITFIIVIFISFQKSFNQCHISHKQAIIGLFILCLTLCAFSLVAMVTLFTSFLNPIDFYKYTTPYMWLMTLIKFLLLAGLMPENQ